MSDSSQSGGVIGSLVVGCVAVLIMLAVVGVGALIATAVLGGAASYLLLVPVQQDERVIDLPRTEPEVEAPRPERVEPPPVAVPPSPAPVADPVPVPVPAPSPAPVPVAAPVPAPPASAEPTEAMARIDLGSDGVEVVLIAQSDGDSYPVPGDVPQGRYLIRATFPDEPAVDMGSVTVFAGEERTVACNARMGICRIQ